MAHPDSFEMLIGSSSRDIRRRNRDDSSNLMSLQKKTILMRGGLAAILFIGHFAAADTYLDVVEAGL